MMGVPNFLVFLLLWSWPAIAAALFMFMPARRAMAAAVVIGWLFLPMFAFPIPFVKWDKQLVTVLGPLLGVLIFDTDRILKFKPGLIDLPMVVWCVIPYISAVANGLGSYDGSAAAATQTIYWGLPYYLGRLYFGDFIGMRGVAVWMFVAGLLYIPFCQYECLMSPQLHFMFYGFYQHDFNQVIRFGGYRPMVFMQHGLAVGMLMTGASLAGIWLWWTGSLKTIFKMPIWVPLLALIVTSIRVKSSGALGLLAMGLAVMWVAKFTKSYLVMIVLCIVPFAYMGARSIAGWDGASLTQTIEELTERDRAMSLQCRFDNENLLLDKAMKKPFFGWGPNGRNLVTRDDGTIESIPDGLWVIAIGSNGILGLLSLFLSLLLPVILVGSRIKNMSWEDPLISGVVSMSVVVALHAIDNLMNAMLSPIFLMALGGIAGVVAAPQALLRGVRTRRMPAMPARQRVATA